MPQLSDQKRLQRELSFALNRLWEPETQTGRGLSGCKLRQFTRLLKKKHRLGDGDIRVCQHAIQELFDAKTIRDVSATRNTDHESLRVAIADTLGTLRDPRGAAPLLQFLADSREPVRLAALRSLRMVAAPCIARSLVALAVEQPELKSEALKVLLEMGSSAVDELLQLTQENDEAMALEAIVALGLIGDDRATKALIYAMDHASDVLCFHLIDSMGRIQDRRAISHLRRTARNANPVLRLSAISALSRIPDANCHRTFVMALNDDDVDVQVHAAAALGIKSDSSAVPALLEQLDDESIPLRLEVIKSLGKLRDQSASDRLRQCLEDPTDEIRAASAEALEMIKVDDSQVHQTAERTVQHVSGDTASAFRQSNPLSRLLRSITP